MAVSRRSGPRTDATAGSEDGLLDALVQTSFVTMALLSRIGVEYDLSLTQLRMLGILRDHRPRMTALADHLGLEKSSLSGLVDRAEKRGLLERAPCADDRRASEVFLTEAGAELAAQLYERAAEALAPMLDTLSVPEQARLRAMLRRVLGT